MRVQKAEVALAAMENNNEQSSLKTGRSRAKNASIEGDVETPAHKDVTEGEKSRNHIWLRLLALGLIIGGLTAILYETGLIRFFLDKARLINFLNSLGPWAFAGFIFLQSLQVVIAPIPGEVTGLLGGFLFGPVVGVALSTIGLTLGSFVAFMLSRLFGRPFAERFVPKSVFARFDYLLHHRGAFLVFLLFLIPGFPKDFLCYVLGLGHLSIIEFVVIGGFGRLVGTVLLTLGGNFIRLHQYERLFVLLGASLLMALATMAYKDKLERFFRSWHLKRHDKDSSKHPH